jgi:hypothetical protein
VTTRRERIEAILKRGDPSEILAALPGPCGCLGPRDGEPECVCRMTDKQIRSAVSVYALQHGKLLKR